MSTNKKMNLFQISTEMQNVFSQLINPETGEINMEADAAFAALVPMAEEKCTAVAMYIKKLESDKAEIAFIKEQVLQREAAYSKEIAKLQNYLESNMLRCGISEIRSPLFTLKIKTNPYSTEILDESVIPVEYMKTREVVKTETKPDKNAIKEEVIKSGVQIPGAYVSQKKVLHIVVDKL